MENKNVYIKEFVVRHYLFFKTKEWVLMQGNGFLANFFTKEAAEKAKEKYFEWINLPKYVVFELDSGEYQLLEKNRYWYNGCNYEYFHTVYIYEYTKQYKNRYDVIFKNKEYYDTMVEACDALSKLEHIVDTYKKRMIKKRIDCV